MVPLAEEDRFIQKIDAMNVEAEDTMLEIVPCTIGERRGTFLTIIQIFDVAVWMYHLLPKICIQASC